MSRLASTVGTNNLLVSYHLEKLLLLILAAPRQILPHAPIAIRAKSKVRMRVDQIHRFIKFTALNFSHLFLVVGVSHVHVHVRDDQQIPPLRRMSASP